MFELFMHFDKELGKLGMFKQPIAGDWSIKFKHGTTNFTITPVGII